MTFFFHPEAEKELNLAIKYYENIKPALGYDFALEVYATIKRSVKYPKAWSLLEGNIRRSLVRKFPYGVLYTERSDGLYILAVMDLHRKPDYWKERTKEI